LLPRCRRISLQGGPGASATSLLLRGVSADGGGGDHDAVSGYGVRWRLALLLLVLSVLLAKGRRKVFPAVGSLSGLLWVVAAADLSSGRRGRRWRCWSAEARHPWWQWLVPILCFQDAEEAAGAVVCRRTDRARPSRGGCCRRRRASIQSQGSSACGPDRWKFSVGFNSSVAAGVLCGSFQSLRAMEFPLVSGSAAAAGDGVVWQRRRRGILQSLVWIGSMGFVVFFVFLEALSASRVGQLSFVFLYGILVCVCFP